MFCEKCGNPINDNELFCSNCGKAIEREEKPKVNNAPEASKFNAPIMPQPPMPEKPKKKNSKLPIIIIAAILVIAIAAGAVWFFVLRDKGSDSDSKKDSKAGKETTDTVPVDAYDEDDTNEDTFDFSFDLNGVTYQLPASVSDFTDNGWTLYDEDYYDEDYYDYDSGEIDYIYMWKGEEKITLQVKNMTGDSVNILDCTVCSFSVDEDDISVDFSVCGTIDFNSSYDDIVNALGEPGYKNIDEDWIKCYYFAGEASHAEKSLCFSFCDGELEKIKICNYNAEDFYVSASTETPDYVTDYVAPTAMGDSVASGIVDIDGDLYQLPAPVSEFVDNGWKIVVQYGSMDTYQNIVLERDGKRINLEAASLDEEIRNAENFSVFEVDSDYMDVNIAIGPADNPITIGTSKDVVDDLVTEDFSFDDDGYCYCCSQGGVYVEIWFDEDSDTVSEITICNYGD